MTDGGETNNPYVATLLRLKDEKQTREFASLTQAILWLSGELEAGDGYSFFGEVQYKGKVLWRKGAPDHPKRER